MVNMLIKALKMIGVKVNVGYETVMLVEKERGVDVMYAGELDLG